LWTDTTFSANAPWFHSLDVTQLDLVAELLPDHGIPMRCFGAKARKPWFFTLKAIVRISVISGEG
jgi:hypothetical protein